MLFIPQGHKGVKGEAGEPGKQGHMVRTSLSLLYLFTFVLSMAIGQLPNVILPPYDLAP